MTNYKSNLGGWLNGHASTWAWLLLHLPYFFQVVQIPPIHMQMQSGREESTATILYKPPLPDALYSNSHVDNTPGISPMSM